MNEKIPVGSWPKWPGGYPGAIEAALLDAVFSMQARFSDDPHRGPRGVVNRWISDRGEPEPDDLSQLAKFSPEDLHDILGNSSKGNRGRTLKSDLTRSAAKALLDVGVSSSDQLQDHKAAGDAWTSVTGLGWVTFVYFCKLLGRPGVKADVMMR